MTIHFPIHLHRMTAIALLVCLGGTGLAGCTSSGITLNRSLESVHQPVVQRTNYTFDLATGPSGLAPAEQRRLANWFEAMDLRYGDRIAIDDPLASNATRATVETVASRFGIMLGGEAPATPGYVNAGAVRVVISRTSASVPGCPDWGTKSDTNLHNATASGYGCAINGNLAAMVANPEDLVKGTKGSLQTTVMAGTKAIETFRSAKPSGAGGTKIESTSTQQGE